MGSAFLWPETTCSECDTQVRPQAERDKRFTPVSTADLHTAMRQDQGQAQVAVQEAKAARRATGGYRPRP